MGRLEQSTMPLGAHLEELRRRLAYALLGLLPIFVAALIVGKSLLGFLVEPARKAIREAGYPDSLQTTGPMETFGTYLTVSLILTIVVGAPWALYQLWLFVAPGLYEREKRFVHLLFPLSGVLTIGSLFFVHYVVVPLMLVFFVGFGTDIGASTIPVKEVPAGVVLPMVPVLEGDPPSPKVGTMWIVGSEHQLRMCVGEEWGKPLVLRSPLTRDAGLVPQYRISEYIGMVQSMALATAAVFQTPAVVLLLGWAGLITPALLSKYRRHAILVCSILAAFITPGTDPASMMAMFLPMYALYELGAILLKWFPASKVGRRGIDEQVRDDDAGELEPAGAGDP